MPASTPIATREQVLALLDGGNAHMSLDEAVADFPSSAMSASPPNVPYTPWHLLEHIRLAQRDILDFMRDPDYQEQTWPDDYWPAADATATEADWQVTVDGIHDDLAAVRAIVADPATGLDDPVVNAGGDPKYTVLRQALLVADHNAYHLGEFAILRQVMGTWPPDHH
ncbi:MAG: DinB family protein [Thermomicrobiales bacterium]